MPFASLNFLCQKIPSSVIEVTCINGCSLLINFHEQAFGAALAALSSVQIGRSDVRGRGALTLQDLWIKESITTFKYLAVLNHSSYRSVNNDQLYPIFLLVVQDGKICDFVKLPVVAKDSSLWLSFFAPFRDYLQIKGDPAQFLVVWNTRTELSPEFFNCPECFHGMPLPPFCTNEFEFVYFLRGLLESKPISQTIHCWFSLFIKGHPPRCPTRENNIPPISLNIPSFSHGVYVSSTFIVVRNNNIISQINLQGQEM
jgi:hypothetical protein